MFEDIRLADVNANNNTEQQVCGIKQIFKKVITNICTANKTCS